MIKCKVFNCSVDLLENNIGRWLTEADVGDIDSVTTVGYLTQRVLTLIFYSETLKIARPPSAPREGVPECPDCRTRMQVKANKTSGNLFWGCPRYPDCTGTRQFTDEDQEKYGGGPRMPKPTVPPLKTEAQQAELREQKTALRKRLDKSIPLAPPVPTAPPLPPEGHGPHDGPDEDDIPF